MIRKAKKDKGPGEKITILVKGEDGDKKQVVIIIRGNGVVEWYGGKIVKGKKTTADLKDMHDVTDQIISELTPFF